MGWLAALLSLGFTLLAGLVLVIFGAVFATWTLQALAVRLKADKPPFKRTWKLSCLALLSGFVLGQTFQLAFGGPSPLVPLFSVPIYLAIYVGLLRWKLPTPFALAGWRRRSVGLAVIATLAATVGIAAFVGVIGCLIRW